MTVPEWSVEDLIKIAETGFWALNVKVDEATIKLLAKESEGSPLLMQRFCWNICFDNEIDETCVLERDLGNIDTNQIFNEVAEDAGLPIYEKLSRGPPIPNRSRPEAAHRRRLR